MKIISDDVTPMYVQLANHIRDLIKSGQVGEGQCIGGQTELAEEYGVSRVTARRAIKLLESQGLVVTRQGKGSYAARASVSQELGSLLSLDEILEAQGMNHEVRIIDFSWIVMPEAVRPFFGGAENSPVLCVKRQHLVNGLPLALAVLLIRPELGVSIKKEDMEKYPLYSILEGKLGVKLGRAMQSIRAEAATEELARELDVKLGYPLLVARRCTYSAEDVPVEHITFFYHSDYYQLTVNLQRAVNFSLVVPPFPTADEVEGREPQGFQARVDITRKP